MPSQPKWGLAKVYSENSRFLIEGFVIKPWELPFKSEMERIANDIKHQHSEAESNAIRACILGFMVLLFIANYAPEWVLVPGYLLLMVIFFWPSKKEYKSVENDILKEYESIPGYTEARGEAERIAREREEQQALENQAERERKKILWEVHREPTIRSIATEVFRQDLEFEWLEYSDKLYVNGRNFKFYYENVLNRTFDSIEEEMKSDYSNWKSPSVSSRRYRRSSGYFTSDDDINSVDGGPPSEASDDDDG